MGNIRQIAKRGDDSLWNGFLIGLGAGVLIGIVDVTTPCPSGDSYWCGDYTHLSRGKKGGIAAGYTAGGMAMLSWYPAGYGYKDGLRYSGLALGLRGAMNLVREFTPLR